MLTEVLDASQSFWREPVVYATYKRIEQYFLDGDLPSLIRIPPGVWHADQNLGAADAAILNFPTVPYDQSTPDKYRIDPHSGEIPFDWDALDG